MLLVVLPTSLGAAAAASASPSPAPTPRMVISGSGSNVFIDQSTAGPGTIPPEGYQFARGSPISPSSPYDWLTGTPVTPGVAGIAQYEITAAYHATGADFTATFGFGGLTGSTTNALYWGEPLIPNLDAHGLSRVVPYSVVFPSHAGQDDATAGSAAALNASAAAPDGTWKVQGGYFYLTQSDRFVFAPPPLTSVIPSLGIATAESLGPGPPAIDGWPADATSLPLLGADGILHAGDATLEVSDALLPSLPNTDARLTMGSLVLDRGDYGRFSLQLAHLWTTGDPISTTTYYGVDPVVYPSALGRLFTSELGDQVQTIAGARAFFHPLSGWDALAELGRSWYEASLVSHPGTAQLGNYEHFSIARHLRSGLATLEYHRFDPTYATAVLPYGVPENIWSIAWSWPGVWLKSTYQLVDNTTIGANRAGYHFRYDGTGKTIEFHFGAGDWRQLVPETFANASHVGFVDGFFLLQRNRFATYGKDQQLAAYVAWHLPHDDLSLDAVDDYLSRPADPQQPVDTVAISAPQLVFTWSHRFNKKTTAATGYGRYTTYGTWALAPVNAASAVVFAGAQFATGPKTALMIEARRYTLVGLPTMPGGLPPTMHGTGLIVDQSIGL